MKVFKKIMKWLLISITSLILLMIVGLYIYTLDASKPLDEMYTEIELLERGTIVLKNEWDVITLIPENPVANIVFIPGGKVYAESYLYLAYQLALEGYQVHVTKNLFHLAILTPFHFNKFLSNELDNIVIGHSLGGTVGGLLTDDARVSKLILLGSYTTNLIMHADVLLIRAENDLVLNINAYLLSYSNYVSYETKTIPGGNHAGFGWYGVQSGDGNALISIKEQQDQTIDYIVEFLT